MRNLFVVLICLSLAACGGNNNALKKAVSPSLTAVQQSGASIWQPQNDDYLLHLNSGVRLPLYVSDYERISVMEFNPDGSDVGITYKHRDKNTFGEVTLYISRYPDIDVNDYFNKSASDIVKRFPEHKLILDGQYKSKLHSQFNGSISVFEGKMGPHSARSGLWLIESKGWFLKARYSYEYDGKKGMSVAIQQFAPLISEAIKNFEKTGKNEVTMEMNGDVIADLLIGTISEGIYSDMRPSFDVITSMDISNIHE